MRILNIVLLCIILTPAMAETYKGNPISALIRVPYAWGSSTFKPDAEAKEMLEDAKYAALVYVSGRTSTTKPSARDERLAFERAAAARKYLIDRGVSPLKIMVNYVSADDFISDNSTREGQMTNQRVDIEMVFVPMY
jgi:outer membrane protein OmpA-like peptidoglycan-associated protein